MRRYSATVLLFLLSAPVAFAWEESHPPGQGAFATGKYRNLFVGHTKEQVRSKINSAFQQLFHGNPDTQAVYFAAGSNANGPLAYICDVAHQDVRSEGMSYGMMIAVQLDKQSEFNALWNWAKTNMEHSGPDHPALGFFSWQMKTDGTAIDEMPAPDGEEYFVTALYFAAARWHSGEGIYNYRAEADRLLSNMLHREPIAGATITGPITAGALFDSERALVRFSPDVRNNQYTDPSYHLPAFYELWALWGPPADRAFWKRAAASSRDFFVSCTNSKTGLSPDYSHLDSRPWNSSWNPQSGDFLVDAWRTAMNWSVDWAWWAADDREQQLSDRIQAFFQSQGVAKYGNHYTLDGQLVGKDHSVGLVAMNAVASLSATDRRSREFVEALWKSQIPVGQYRYYDGLLYLLGLLHTSGEFRIWNPDAQQNISAKTSTTAPGE